MVVRKFIHRGALITVVVMATITMKLMVLMDVVLLMKEVVEVSLMKVLVVFGVDECGGVDDGGSGSGVVEGGSEEHGDGYNMQMGAIIHLLTRFERRH